jgi:hypothetical protein
MASFLLNQRERLLEEGILNILEEYYIKRIVKEGNC